MSALPPKTDIKGRIGPRTPSESQKDDLKEAIHETSPPQIPASGSGRRYAAVRLALRIGASLPTRPVRIIVGFPAGVAPDIVARVIGQALSERLGQQFIVENRPGAGSNIGAEIVVRAPPDGYALLLAVSSGAINATLYSNLSFNFIRDIAPVAMIGLAPFVMVVNPKLPTKTFPNSSPMPRPIPARSTWRHRVTDLRPISWVNFSR